jgi:hypothetical protein
LQIWLKQTGLIAFSELNAAICNIVSILNTQTPDETRNILMRVCLLFGSPSLVLFLQLTREWSVLWKWAFYKTPGLQSLSTILPSVGLYAG